MCRITAPVCVTSRHSAVRAPQLTRRYRATRLQVKRKLDYEYNSARGDKPSTNIT